MFSPPQKCQRICNFERPQCIMFTANCVCQPNLHSNCDVQMTVAVIQQKTSVCGTNTFDISRIFLVFWCSTAKHFVELIGYWCILSDHLSIENDQFLWQGPLKIFIQSASKNLWMSCVQCFTHLYGPFWQGLKGIAGPICILNHFAIL